MALAVVAAGTVLAAAGVNGRMPGAVALRARGLRIGGVVAVAVAAASVLHWFVL